LCWAVFGQTLHKNQSKTKHEESIVITCLDEGSTPSGSTLKPRYAGFFVLPPGPTHQLATHY